jgi:hypothetical protein
MKCRRDKYFFPHFLNYLHLNLSVSICVNLWAVFCLLSSPCSSVLSVSSWFVFCLSLESMDSSYYPLLFTTAAPKATFHERGINRRNSLFSL